MEAESRYTYVGAAVLGLIVALIAAVLWLKNVGGEDKNLYAIVFEQQDLDGLAIGAEVSLRGIQVGRVRDYALTGRTGDRVRVEVSIDRRVPVFTGTVAVVTRNFLTGLAAITLVNRQPAGKPLVDVPPGETLPLIAEGQSEMDELTGRMSRVGDVASEALANVAQLFNEVNRSSLMATVDSMRQLAVGINQRLDTVEKSLATMATAADRTGQAATQLGEAGQRLVVTVERSAEQLNSTLAQGELTLKQGRQALASADTVMLEARQSLAQMNTAVAVVQRQAEVTGQRLEGTLAGVDDQVRAAVADLRSNAEVAARTLDRLADPRARLLGPSAGQLGPGEAAR
jgi:phospholipid/cholesterol/gamma-HCH transport system substrate-binding protein